MTKKVVPALATTIAITPKAGVLTALGQVVKIKPANPKKDPIDTTDLSSAWMEALLSIPDGGECEFTILWDSTNAGHAAVWTNFTDASPTDAMAALWTITFNDKVTTEGTTVTFNGAVSAFPWDELDVKKVSTVPVTVKITGAITITPAT